MYGQAWNYSLQAPYANLQSKAPTNLKNSNQNHLPTPISIKISSWIAVVTATGSCMHLSFNYYWLKNVEFTLLG